MVYLRQGEKVYAVSDRAELQRWIVDGRVSATDLISKGGKEWFAAGSVPELRPFFDLLERLARLEAIVEGKAGPGLAVDADDEQVITQASESPFSQPQPSEEPEAPEPEAPEPEEPQVSEDASAGHPHELVPADYDDDDDPDSGEEVLPTIIEKLDDPTEEEFFSEGDADWEDEPEWVLPSREVSQASVWWIAAIVGVVALGGGLLYDSMADQEPPSNAVVLGSSTKKITIEAEPSTEPKTASEDGASDAVAEVEPEPPPEPDETPLSFTAPGGIDGPIEPLKATDRELAQADLSRAAPTAVKKRPAQNSFKQNIDQAWKAIDKGNHSKASKLFKKALGQRSKDAEANYGYGYVLLKLEQPERSQTYLCRALRASGGSGGVAQDVNGLLRYNNLSCL